MNEKSEALNNFYSAIGEITRAADSMCRDMTLPAALRLRRALFDTVRCIDEVGETSGLYAPIAGADIHLNKDITYVRH